MFCGTNCCDSAVWRTNICDVKNANWEREGTIVLIFQIQMIQTYLSSRKIPCSPSKLLRGSLSQQRNNLGQLGNHFSYYLYLLKAISVGLQSKTTPRSRITRYSLHTTESLTSATARSPNFRSAPWRKSFPGSRLQCFCWLETWRWYQVIKNMSTPEIFTCHSTFTSYQFSFYKEESYNHGLYMTII